jgi:NifU homolog involved in Fe-S cluster formation
LDHRAYEARSRLQERCLNASDDEPDLAIGKTIEEALKITRNDVAENLEGLPPVKMHCSNLAADALHAAIEDYLKKEGRGEWLNGTKKATEKKSGAKKGARRRRAA